MKTPLAVLCTAGAITAIAAPALGSGPTVRVSEYKFTAKSIHIKRGATVKWTWPAAGAQTLNAVTGCCRRRAPEVRRPRPGPG